MIEIHPNLKQLSHSSDNVLHGCPRKYELYKLTGQKDALQSTVGDYHLDFGSVVGSCVQDYLIHEDLNHAYMLAFMLWGKLGKILDDEEGVKDKKVFWYILYAIDKFVFFRKTALAPYDLAYLNNRPAVELGFSIDCGDGFFYRGFVDAVLIHRSKRKLVPFECKTTKSYQVNEASFKNSGQALGYSVTLDIVAPLLDIPVESSYEVLYPVYKTLPMEWELLPFTKNNTHRAKWIKNILIDKQHIIQFAEDDFFPMHGEHCFSFFRQCPYFGTCEFKTELLVGKSPEVRVEKASKYDYHFKLSDIIENQLAKVG